MIKDKDLRYVLGLQTKAFEETMVRPSTVEEFESLIKTLGPLMFNPDIMNRVTRGFHEVLDLPITPAGVDQCLARTSDLLLESLTESGEPSPHEILTVAAAIGLMRASIGPEEADIVFFELGDSSNLKN